MGLAVVPPSSALSKRAFAARLLLAVLLTATLLAIASAALSVTTAPVLFSLVVEPFSLLLMPGMLISMALAGRHDEVSVRAVLIACACVYFVVFSVVLARWPWRARAHSRSR